MSAAVVASHLTVGQVAEALNVHPQTVRRWLRDGQLVGTLLSRRAGWRIPRDQVDYVLAFGVPAPKTANGAGPVPGAE